MSEAMWCSKGEGCYKEKEVPDCVSDSQNKCSRELLRDVSIKQGNLDEAVFQGIDRAFYLCNLSWPLKISSSKYCGKDSDMAWYPLFGSLTFLSVIKSSAIATGLGDRHQIAHLIVTYLALLSLCISVFLTSLYTALYVPWWKPRDPLLLSAMQRQIAP